MYFYCEVSCKLLLPIESTADLRLFEALPARLIEATAAAAHLPRSLLPFDRMGLCGWCHERRAILKRPKTGASICKECFFFQFEDEIHQTIVGNQLFRRGEKVAIAASGGKGTCCESYWLR